MRKKKWSKKYGGTAACTMRLIKKSQYSGGSDEEKRRKAKEIKKREFYFGDSWFTGRRLIMGMRKEGLLHEYFGALKTNKSGVPKAEVEKLMADWPAGSILVLECKEHELFYVGYKYSFKKKGGNF